VSKYKIAEVAIEFKEDGTPMYWVYNAGYHPGQGGMEFVYGNFGTPSLETSLELLKERLVRDLDHILEEIKRREAKE
jgi:hypothetical protein